MDGEIAAGLISILPTDKALKGASYAVVQYCPNRRLLELMTHTYTLICPVAIRIYTKWAHYSKNGTS